MKTFRSAFSFLTVFCLSAVMSSGQSIAAEIRGDQKAQEVAKSVYERPDGNIVKRRLRIELIDANGQTRERSAIVVRQRNSDVKKTIVMYDAPRSIRGTAYLSKDKVDAQLDDDQFLYLPALKRERRIPNSERGDYFLGTDFSFEDVRNELKFDPKDYVFKYSGEMQGLLGSTPNVLLEAEVSSQEIANELGYSKLELTIDPTNSMIMFARYFDLNGALLKTVEVSDVREIQGIATAHEITVRNQQTGHTTRFTYSNVEYLSNSLDHLFQFDVISQGPRQFK